MPSERARVIGLLDAFQAAERVGAEAVARWIASCSDDRLRAGLRVIRTGLAPSDRIVIDGLQRARPGQKVTPEEGKIEPTAR